ncbi:INO80 complex subunit C [Nematocida sp. AWRm77]|nr:INO80 complex subunit C [Nematocida sp. AWRm77]
MKKEKREKGGEKEGEKEKEALVSGESGRVKNKTLKQMYARLSIESPFFVSLFTRVSVMPQIQLCDITGLKAHYVCPRTGLHYHSMEVYERIRELSIDTAQSIGKVRSLGKDMSPFGKK